jgi:hypothetical protein
MAFPDALSVPSALMQGIVRSLATYDDDISFELSFPHFQRDRAESLERTKSNFEATISELANEEPTVEIVAHLLEGDPGETLCANLLVPVCSSSGLAAITVSPNSRWARLAASARTTATVL